MSVASTGVTVSSVSQAEQKLWLHLSVLTLSLHKHLITSWKYPCLKVLQAQLQNQYKTGVTDDKIETSWSVAE